MLSAFPLNSTNSGQPTSPLTDTPFQSEEGFEVLVFNDQLYLGMEADNLLGARIWRTRRGVTAPQSQLDWEEVAADAAGYPFGVRDTAQADHIDSLAEFNGWIYASLANRSGSPKGTLVFRSPTGDAGTWEDALPNIGPGFGKSQNENFKDMQVFNNHLCGGTWNETDGAEVWCTLDGNTWLQKNNSGFSEFNNIIIWSGHVFNDALYFGVQNTGGNDGDGHGRLYRTASLEGIPIWEEVFRTKTGVPWGNILGDINGYIYISTPSKNGISVYRSVNGNPDSWEIANHPGFNQNSENRSVLADGAVVYNGNLYLGVVNWQSNFSIWHTTGGSKEISILEDWDLVSTTEIENPYNIFVQLAVFNDAIYAWTSNPVNGQQVWRSVCKFSSD